jgi:hypothetical protein
MKMRRSQRRNLSLVSLALLVCALAACGRSLREAAARDIAAYLYLLR